MGARKPWTTKELNALRKQYPDTPTKALAESLGRTLTTVYQQAHSLGLSKSAAYLASPAACRTNGRQGAGTRFKKGQAAWNKGTNFDAGGRSVQTRFKPGHLGGRAAEKYQPIGTERVSKDGYQERKIHDGLPLQSRWRAVHLVEWEAINGPLPAGHALVFRDGNKSNTAPANMELVTRAELMRRNTLHRYPKEIALAIQLKGALQRQINKRERA